MLFQRASMSFCLHKDLHTVHLEESEREKKEEEIHMACVYAAFGVCLLHRCVRTCAVSMYASLHKEKRLTFVSENNKSRHKWKSFLNALMSTKISFCLCGTNQTTLLSTVGFIPEFSTKVNQHNEDHYYGNHHYDVLYLRFIITLAQPETTIFSRSYWFFKRSCQEKKDF